MNKIFTSQKTVDTGITQGIRPTGADLLRKQVGKTQALAEKEEQKGFKRVEEATKTFKTGLETESKLQMNELYNLNSDNPEELFKQFQSMNEKLGEDIPIEGIREEVVANNLLTQQSLMTRADNNFNKQQTKKNKLVSSESIDTSINSLKEISTVFFNPEESESVNNTKIQAQNEINNIINLANSKDADGFPIFSDSEKDKMLASVSDIKTLGYETNVDELFEVSPEKAEAYMQDMELNKDKFIKKYKIDNEEYDDMLSYNKTVRSRFKIAELQKQTIGSQAGSEIITNPELSTANKKIEINKLLLEGSITSQYAGKLKGVLLSDKAIGASDDADAMADIILRVNDLNARADLDQEDYLIGVRNIRDEILDRRTSGNLSEEGSTKLNNQISTLTSAKISGATNIVGYNFNVGSDMFENQLPPEFRGKATRELFYQTEGQEPTEAEQKALATTIIDSINVQRRDKTIQRVNEIKQVQAVNVEEEAKKLNISISDIKETARIHNLTEEQVIQRLKGN